MTGRSWREVLGHSLFFMWPRVLDLWLVDMPENKWWREGGSDQFYRCEVDIWCHAVSSIVMCGPVLWFTWCCYREFLPQYYERNPGSFKNTTEEDGEVFSSPPLFQT